MTAISPPYGHVKGLFHRVSADTLDEGSAPDVAGDTALEVRFVPSVTRVVDTSNPEEPRVLTVETVPAKVTPAGLLTGANGEATVPLLATTGVQGHNPAQWHWTAQFNRASMPDVTFTLSAGQTVDLATLTPAPAPAGTVRVVDEALVARVEAGLAHVMSLERGLQGEKGDPGEKGEPGEPGKGANVDKSTLAPLIRAHITTAIGKLLEKQQFSTTPEAVEKRLATHVAGRYLVVDNYTYSEHPLYAQLGVEQWTTENGAPLPAPQGHIVVERYSLREYRDRYRIYFAFDGEPQPLPLEWEQGLIIIAHLAESPTVQKTDTTYTAAQIEFEDLADGRTRATLHLKEAQWGVVTNATLDTRMPFKVASLGSITPYSLIPQVSDLSEVMRCSVSDSRPGELVLTVEAGQLEVERYNSELGQNEQVVAGLRELISTDGSFSIDGLFLREGVEVPDYAPPLY